MSQPDNFSEEMEFGEFRRQIKAAEMLSASMERLLLSLRFTGKVSVEMQNGVYLNRATRKNTSASETSAV